MTFYGTLLATSFEMWSWTIFFSFLSLSVSFHLSLNVSRLLACVRMLCLPYPVRYPVRWYGITMCSVVSLTAVVVLCARTLGVLDVDEQKEWFNVNITQTHRTAPSAPPSRK